MKNERQKKKNKHWSSCSNTDSLFLFFHFVCPSKVCVCVKICSDFYQKYESDSYDRFIKWFLWLIRQMIHIFSSYIYVFVCVFRFSMIALISSHIFFFIYLNSSIIFQKMYSSLHVIFTWFICLLILIRLFLYDFKFFILFRFVCFVFGG